MDIPLTYPTLEIQLGYQFSDKKMIQTKVFKNNQSQAVRLPKSVALPEHIKDVNIFYENK